MNQPNSQTMSDTWRPPIGPRVLILFAHKRTRVTIQFADNQPMKMCHIIQLTCHHDGTALPRGRTDCTDRYSQHFFPCLTFWTDRYIFRSRCPFETKRVALGSRRRGLQTHLFWSNSENFDFWAKIWPLVQILIKTGSLMSINWRKPYTYWSKLPELGMDV